MLVALARTGDLDAFESIVRSRTDAVYRLSLAILGNEADARDATQETFIAAWRQLPKLREPERFEAWLQRIAVNAARMTLRSRRRRRVREIPADGRAVQATAAGEAEVDAVLLDQAMSRLPIDDRVLLVLHHLEGYGTDEIAKVLDIPPGTVRSRLVRARHTLDKTLREDDR